jgi:hypothetical protein
MDRAAFHFLSPALYMEVFNHIWHNGMRKDGTMTCNAVMYIPQTEDSVDEPDDRRRALFHTKSLLNSFWHLTF